MNVPITLVLSTLPFYWTLILSQDLDQPPRFILEPQDAVLPTARGTDSVIASIHCSHNSSNTMVTWYRNGVPLTYTGTRILYDNGTVEFRPLIALVDVSADGVEYHCVLSNAFGSVISRTALLQSAIFGSEWSIAIAPTSGISVTLGSFVLLPCDPPAANPPPNVVWTRDGTALEPGDTSKYKVLAPEDGGSLIIANVNSSDIGPIYRCRVTNALVFVTRDSPFSYQLDQIESYFEDFTIYDTLESTYTLTTGSDVEFTCLAFGNNVNVFEFLYIRLDDGAIPDNVQRTSSDATTINGRTTMSITGVTEANAGMYRCVIRNLTSGGDSLTLGTRDFTIQVSVTPAITSVPSDQVYNTGENRTLQCTAIGSPAPVISYYFNATLITSGVSNGSGVLTLTNVTTANTGPYQCFGDNVRAETSPLWTIIVNPADNGDGSVARDPHFFLPLINGDHMCFSIQGEPNFAFNLIKDEYIQLNAQFVLPAEDESHTVGSVSTFLGDLGLAITDPETGNITIVKVLAPDHSVLVGHSLTVVMDKPVYVDVSKTVTIKIDAYAETTKLKDESAWLYINTDNFGIKVRFYKKHLDMFLTKTNGLTKDAHGLIGQFLTTDVKIDTENMLMQLGNRRPILVKRGMAWPFLRIDKECWYPKSTDVHQPEVIEGIYTDYIVEQLIPN